VTLVVVGASLAGLRAVESARRAGYDGRVVLVGAEDHLPYDRPPLSKSFLLDEEPPDVAYKTPAQLEELGVELRLGEPATGLDVGARELRVGDDALGYDALVVATGARARHLPGERLAGVIGLRDLDDARELRAALDGGARPVVVGAGFIGSEVASACRARGLEVTVVEAAPTPLARAVGHVAADLLTSLHARAGTDLRCGVGVEGLESSAAAAASGLDDDPPAADGARVTGVRLSDGTRIDADLVVVGIGCAPATDWLEDSGLTVDGGLACDAALRAADGVWAAGDVARIDHPVLGPLRLEHWTSAAEQGALAGANAVAALSGGEPRDYAGVPYFWSDVYGSKVQMVGLPQGDEVELLGDPEGPWLLLYRDGDRLAAALSLDLPGRIMKFTALLARGAAFDDALELARSKPLPTRAAAAS
jgi:NADPH-dependent 2,4-dienoyl-CoA reductase/sulfur reductase-like enzyme